MDLSLGSHPLVVASVNGRLPALRSLCCSSSPWGAWLVLAGGLHGAWPQLQQLRFEGGLIKYAESETFRFSSVSLLEAWQELHNSSDSGSSSEKGSGSSGDNMSGGGGGDGSGILTQAAGQQLGSSPGVVQLNQVQMLAELGRSGAWSELRKLVFRG